MAVGFDHEGKWALNNKDYQRKVATMPEKLTFEVLSYFVCGPPILLWLPIVLYLYFRGRGSGSGSATSTSPRPVDPDQEAYERRQEEWLQRYQQKDIANDMAREGRERQARNQSKGDWWTF